MTATHVVRIDPNGTVTRLVGLDLPGLALDGLAPIGGYHGMSMWGDRIDRDDPSIDMVSCRANGLIPWPAGMEDVPLVGAVHEWGCMIDLPVNPKAWSLYGRSPLVGPAFFALDLDYTLDDRPALPDEWLTAIEGDPVWITPDVMGRMRAVAEQVGARWL